MVSNTSTDNSPSVPQEHYESLCVKVLGLSAEDFERRLEGRGFSDVDRVELAEPEKSSTTSQNR